MKRIATLTLAALVLAGSLAMPASAETHTEFLVGRWQTRFQSAIGLIQVDLLLMHGGRFSQLASVTSWHGTDVVRTAGRWYVVRPGWIRFHNDVCSTRNCPKTESHAYEILDRDHVRVDGVATYTRGRIP